MPTFQARWLHNTDTEYQWMQKEMFQVRQDWSHLLVEGHLLMLECEECQSSYMWLAG